MPVDVSGINSILQAMMAGAEVRKSREEHERQLELDKQRLAQQKIENQFRQNESDRAQQQLEAYISHLNAESEHQKNVLDLQRSQHQMQAEQAVNQFIASGSMQKPTQQIVPPSIDRTQMQPGPETGQPDISQLPYQRTTINPGVATQGGPVQYGGTTVDTTPFLTREDIQRRDLEFFKQMAPIQAQAKANEAGMIKMAEVPAAVAIEKNKMEGQKDLQTQKDIAAMNRTKESTEGQKIVAGIRANATMNAAKLRAFGGMSPDDFTNEATKFALGQSPRKLGVSPADRMMSQALTKQGLVEVTADRTKKLAAVHDVDALYDKMKSFVSKLPVSALGANFNEYIEANKHLKTEWSNLQQELAGVSGNIARTMGAETGRLTDADIRRAMGLLVTPGITRQMAVDRMQFFRSNYNTKVLKDILGGVPDKQKLMLFKAYEFDPATVNDKITINGKTGERFHFDGNEWRYYDPQAGGYVKTDYGIK